MHNVIVTGRFGSKERQGDLEVKREEIEKWIIEIVKYLIDIKEGLFLLPPKNLNSFQSASKLT